MKLLTTLCIPPIISHNQDGCRQEYVTNPCLTKPRRGAKIFLAGYPFSLRQFLGLKPFDKKAMELAERAHLPVIGGSDAHRAEKIGEALTIFPEDCHSVEDPIKAILDGRTHIQGAGRNTRETFRYGSRSISQWFGRGMKRL